MTDKTTDNKPEDIKTLYEQRRIAVRNKFKKQCSTHVNFLKQNFDGLIDYDRLNTLWETYCYYRQLKLTSTLELLETSRKDNNLGQCNNNINLLEDQIDTINQALNNINIKNSLLAYKAIQLNEESPEVKEKDLLDLLFPVTGKALEEKDIPDGVFILEKYFRIQKDKSQYSLSLAEGKLQKFDLQKEKERLLLERDFELKRKDSSGQLQELNERYLAATKEFITKVNTERNLYVAAIKKETTFKSIAEIEYDFFVQQQKSFNNNADFLKNMVIKTKLKNELRTLKDKKIKKIKPLLTSDTSAKSETSTSNMEEDLSQMPNTNMPIAIPMPPFITSTEDSKEPQSLQPTKADVSIACAQTELEALGRLAVAISPRRDPKSASEHVGPKELADDMIKQYTEADQESDKINAALEENQEAICIVGKHINSLIKNLEDSSSEEKIRELIEILEKIIKNHENFVGDNIKIIDTNLSEIAQIEELEKQARKKRQATEQVVQQQTTIKMGAKGGQPASSSSSGQGG